MQVTPELISKVAALARLELTDSEKKLFAEQIHKVLSYIDELGEIDVTGVEPMVHVEPRETPLREDVARPFPSAKILQSAPEVSENGYRVPQIMES